MNWHKRIFLFLFIFIPSLSSLAFAEPKGGFFNKEELDRGFFAEPTAEPTAIPTSKSIAAATPAPTESPAAAAISNADIAREIVIGGQDSIEKLKGLQSNPSKREQMLQSLQGVKDSLDQQIRLKTPGSQIPDNRPTPVSIVPPEDLLNDYHPEDLPANITIVVKAEPRASFLRTLDRVHVAVSKLKVTVSKIYIIGQNKDLEQFIPDREANFELLKINLAQMDIPVATKEEAVAGFQEAIPNTQLLLEKLHFQVGNSRESAKEIIQKYEIQSSPAWILDFSGKQTVIQGEIDPREFLTTEGLLNPDLREHELGGSPFGLLKGAEENMVTELNYAPPPVVESEQRKVLPICTRARIRRLQVGPATFGSFFSPEMLIYSAEDAEQLQLAEQTGGATIAYSPLTTAAQAKAASPLLPFMLTLPLRCLPTRMHYVNVGGRQYMELRQGEAAWKE